LEAIGDLKAKCLEPERKVASGHLATKLYCTLLSYAAPYLSYAAPYLCYAAPYLRTVNKLRSINLPYSSMFCIESKIVHVGAEKIITLY
jgi:hypothetical protein